MGATRAAEGPVESAPPRLWFLLGLWTAQELQDHPQAATPGGVLSILQQLDTVLRGGLPDSDGWSLDPSVAPVSRDGRAAFAVAVRWGRSGSFFVVGETVPLRYGLLWSVQDVAEEHFPLRDDVGRWAFRTPGVHDGPLGGSIRELPPSATGSPRFLVDAITHPMMGCDFPGEIGVWEWTGREAVPVFLGTYWTSCFALPLSMEANVVRIGTKEEMRTFFSCGSCPDPRGTWTLKITPEGVEDLGHELEVPELAVIDELFDRLLKGRDTADLAAPDVGAVLVDLLEPGETSLGMFEARAWSRGDERLLYFDSDETPPLTFTVVSRDGGPFVTAVHVRELDEAPQTPEAPPESSPPSQQ